AGSGWWTGASCSESIEVSITSATRAVVSGPSGEKGKGLEFTLGSDFVWQSKLPMPRHRPAPLPAKEELQLALPAATVAAAAECPEKPPLKLKKAPKATKKAPKKAPRSRSCLASARGAVGAIGDQGVASRPNAAAEAQEESLAAVEEASRPPTGAASVLPHSARLPRLRRQTAKAELVGPAHSTLWRSLAREQDPLADPLVLEVAEEVASLLSPDSLVVLCGGCLQGRTGQRFANSVRALGGRVLVAPTARQLQSWADQPRVPGVGPEELVLVSDWQELSSCLGVLRKVTQEWHRGRPQLLLRGGVVLCDRSEERQALALVQAADLPRWRVMPSLAF
ncbi:unnamed protein product, partial [Polarella glacialis]